MKTLEQDWVRYLRVNNGRVRDVTRLSRKAPLQMEGSHLHLQLQLHTHTHTRTHTETYTHRIYIYIHASTDTERGGERPATHIICGIQAHIYTYLYIYIHLYICIIFIHMYVTTHDTSSIDSVHICRLAAMPMASCTCT